jgi:hypothetical protein
MDPLGLCSQTTPRQDCINAFNNSLGGKAVNFLSFATPLLGPDRLSAAIEDTAGTAGKYAIYKGLVRVGQSSAALAYDAEILASIIQFAAKEIVVPAAVAAMAIQVGVNVGCLFQ